MTARRSGTSGELIQLVKALTCPNEGPNIAMRDAYSARPQARAGPFARGDFPWSGLAGDGKTYSIATNQMVLMLRRDPLFAWMHYDPNTAAATWSYLLVFGNTSSGMQTQFPLTVLPTKLALEFAGATVNSTYAPHDDFLYAHYNDEKKRMLWIEGSISRNTTVGMQFVGTGTAPTVTGYMDMYNDNDGDESAPIRFVITNQPMNASFVLYTITDRDYRRFELTITALGGTTPALTAIQGSITGTSDCFCHHALPQLTQNRGNIIGIRQLAASVKWMNSSPVIDLNGRISALQFGKSDSWRAATFLAANSDPYTYLNSQEGAADIPYNKGGFGYLKPDEESDFEVQNAIDQGNGFWSDACSDLRRSGWLLVIARAGTIADTGSATASGRVSSYRVDFKVNYTTRNIWLDSRVPEETPDQWKQAVEAISTMPQFFEDPTIQWGTILKTIGSLARLSAPLVSALGPYGKAAGVVLTGVGEGLGYLGYRTKKTARPPPPRLRVTRSQTAASRLLDLMTHQLQLEMRDYAEAMGPLVKLL